MASYEGLWWNTTTFISAQSKLYHLHRKRIDGWLKRKGLFDSDVYALRKVGPFTLAFRYKQPKRVSKMAPDRPASRLFPKVVRGWPF